MVYHRLMIRLLLAACLLPLSAQAQLIKGHIPGGKQMRWGGIEYSRDFDFFQQQMLPFNMDENDNFVFDTQLPGQFGIVGVNTDGRSIDVVVERGKTMTVNLTTVKDKKSAKSYPRLIVTGPNKTATDYLNSVNRATSITAITGYGRPEERVGKEEGLRILEETITRMRKSLKKVKPQAARDFMSRYTDMLYNHYRLEILSEHRHTHIYWQWGNEDYKKVITEIDPNDPVGLTWRLPHRWVYNQIDPTLANQADLTDYALRYIEVMRPVITDKQVKHCLLDNLVDRVVSQGNPKDVDRFWKPIAEYAAEDTELLNKYLPKIEALKNTRAGKMAPEQTFSDINGKPHQLSELRGKVLYIDVWATWCVPCKNEIPHFAKVAEHYKDNPNILLISISTDREKDHDKWRKMITDEKPAWPQYVMKDAEHEKFSNDFNIQFIPRFIIINADGTIQNADAPRPSDKNIIHTLDEIIKKNAF